MDNNELTKKDQAKLIWIEAKRMAKKSPALRKRLKGLVSEIVGLEVSSKEDYSDTFFKPLGRDSDSLDGLNAHGVLADEVHAWTDSNLWDVMIDSMTAREQPIFIATTTAGTVRENVYDEKYDYFSKVIDGIEGYEDERVLPIIYELDHRDEIHDPKMWRKANPGLGTIKNEMQLMEKYKRAIAVPSQMANLLCKDFNLPQTSSETWLTYETIYNDAMFDMEEIRGSYCIGGVDLAATTDLTCATLLCMKPGSDKKYVVQMYWLPSNLLEQRVTEDKIPYDKWKEKGYLRLSGESANDHRDVTAWFLEMMDKYNLYPFKIGYDRALASAWMQDMREHGFNDCDKNNPVGVLEKVAQGALTFSQPMRYMEADFKDKKIIYNNNPILKWCLSNTVITTDNNDNIRPIKGKGQRLRIDGTMALLNAYVELHKHYQDYMNLI
ncbi:MAG TPA: terminase TerL endonuclease subunit [Bacteroidia bacterium]